MATSISTQPVFQLDCRNGVFIGMHNSATNAPLSPSQRTAQPESGDSGTTAQDKASAIVYADPRSLALLELIRRIAPSDASVLVIGDTGTGKELVARQIHGLSNRANKPFAAINCGAFPENLFESELFGHEKGAFSGATHTKTGWFETANGGTLFLDEVGDLPLSLQVKLLRALQEGEVIRVGGRKTIPVDVRIIAATNRDLEQAVKAGRFREDLYFRLKVVRIPLSPLRERSGDIVPLARHFMCKYVRSLGLPPIRLAQDALSKLSRYSWPGNIRELENTIHSTLLTFTGEFIRAKDIDLPELDRDAPFDVPTLEPADNVIRLSALEHFLRDQMSAPIPQLLDSVIETTVRIAYENAGRNQAQAARILGISRSVLRTHLKNIGLLNTAPTS
ncbi:sigma-54-dependent Fis family transcriptional regulator [Zoogloea sp. LCSB751]|uniref:sigma-54 interaction domain-containing protein n=1 Tax=Zoogloea sp. LCSB751 TaxID=1965277 RepID=UPI0011179D33|nr:sigma-54 dependent transcriptional regulator [Zoogloea sp. LCSB751]